MSVKRGCFYRLLPLLASSGPSLPFHLPYALFLSELLHLQLVTPDHPASIHGLSCSSDTLFQLPAGFSHQSELSMLLKAEFIIFPLNLFLIASLFCWMNVPTIALNLKVILVSFVLALYSHFHCPPPTTPNQSQNPTCLFPKHLSEGSPRSHHSTLLFSTGTITRPFTIGLANSHQCDQSDELPIIQLHQNTLLLSIPKCPSTKTQGLTKNTAPFSRPLITVLPNTSFPNLPKFSPKATLSHSSVPWYMQPLFLLVLPIIHIICVLFLPPCHMTNDKDSLLGPISRWVLLSYFSLGSILGPCLQDSSFSKNLANSVYWQPTPLISDHPPCLIKFIHPQSSPRWYQITQTCLQWELLGQFSKNPSQPQCSTYCFCITDMPTPTPPPPHPVPWL